MKANSVKFANCEFEVRKAEKIGYCFVSDDTTQFERAMNAQIELKNFVIFGEATLKKLLIIGLLSGDIPRRRHIRYLYKAMETYLNRGESYFLSKNPYAKMLLYFLNNTASISDEQSFFYNLDILSGIIEAKDEPDIQKCIEQEHKDFQEKYDKKLHQEILDKIGIKVKFGVGLLPAKDFRDVVNAHSFANVVVTLLNERVLISVKNETISQKLFGNEGLKAIIPFLNSGLALELEDDNTIKTLARQKRGVPNTFNDCERVASLIASRIAPAKATPL